MVTTVNTAAMLVTDGTMPIGWVAIISDTCHNKSSEYYNMDHLNQQQAPHPPPLTSSTVARSLSQQPGLGLERPVTADTE
jgi:hypothetical protein